MKLLIIDASPPYRKMLKALIEAPEKSVYLAASCGEARWMWKQEWPQLILIDPMLPDGDGMEICVEMQRTHPTLILAMSTDSGPGDEIRLLQGGADAYLRKPFLPEQLFAYVEALSRRQRRVKETSEAGTFGSVLEYGPIVMNVDQHLVTLDGKEIVLTPIEYRLLKLLLINQNQIITPGMILHYAWGTGYDDPSVIRAHVHHLRDKIGPYIENVRNVGYRLLSRKEAKERIDGTENRSSENEE